MPPVNPPSTTSSSSSTSKSSSSGKGGGGGDEEDDKPEGKPATKQSGSTIIVETGETVSCPPGTGECTIIVSGTTTVVKVPTEPSSGNEASVAAHKHKKTKPKAIVIGHATITVPVGKSAKVTFKLTNQGAKLLRKLRRLHIKITVEITRLGVAPVKHSGTITITQPKAAKHKKK